MDKTLNKKNINVPAKKKNQQINSPWNNSECWQHIQ